MPINNTLEYHLKRGSFSKNSAKKTLRETA